ncbi:MAG: hypothetical protein PVH98_11670, partial [Gammaproteobacteria bacterium]
MSDITNQAFRGSTLPHSHRPPVSEYRFPRYIFNKTGLANYSDDEGSLAAKGREFWKTEKIGTRNTTMKTRLERVSKILYVKQQGNQDKYKNNR